MNIDYSDIHAARRNAEQQIRMADAATRDAAALVKGRLRVANVPGHVLAELKRELKDFNAHTYRWKGEE